MGYLRTILHGAYFIVERYVTGRDPDCYANRVITVAFRKGWNMKIENCLKRWKSAALLGMFITVLLFPAHSVQAQQAQMDAVVSAAAQILYHNEGSYNSVNPNDNGAVSIGKLQWHGWRALALLRTITQADEQQAQELLGNTLYQEIISTTDTTKWSTRKLTSKEAAAVKKLLATEQSKQAQDVLAVRDITDYISQGQRLGITNEPALVYFADLANQGGSGAAGRVAASAGKFAGGYEAVTLNELHQAAVCDSVMGYSAYLTRRFETYQYAAGLGWTYCGAADSYIPYDYVSARDKGTAWVQRALNTSMKAGLVVTNTYDDATKAAVTRFQTEQKLTVDGYAGKDTIVKLIRTVFQTNADAPNPQPPATNPDVTVPDPQPPIVQEPEEPVPDFQPPIVQEPEVPDVKPLEKTVLTTSKKSYALNDTQGSFSLEVTSSHAQEPLTYRSSESAILTVDDQGMVKILGAGEAEIIVRQRQTDTHEAAELVVPVTVYSTNPADYPKPAGALYAEKNMKKQHVQWLQAALISLDGANLTVNGSWTKTMTKTVTAFQKKCGIVADGIVGDQTQDMLRQMLAVKEKKPEATIKCNASGNTLSWKKYTKADRVYIYRKEKGGAYQRIKTLTNMKKTSFQDQSAKKGATYYYVIRYALKQNKVLVKSPASKGVTGVRR